MPAARQSSQQQQQHHRKQPWLAVGVMAFVCCVLQNTHAWVSFAPSRTTLPCHYHNNNMNRACGVSSSTALCLSSIPPNNDEDSAQDSGEGADLAAEFFQLAQQKGIGLDETDLMEDEDEEEDDSLEEEDDEDVNIPQGAVNAFLGYDTGDVGEKLAGNVSLTNDQLYSEVKERVLDTAGGFVEYVKGAQDEEDEDGGEMSGENKAYKPPETIPDAELTAGEVVLLVLEALRNNNVPETNSGVEILFGFSSPTSQVKTETGLTPNEYAEYLQETEYKVMFLTEYEAAIEKADYSANGQKAFMTARLNPLSELGSPVNVNFILSSVSTGDGDSCWLIDSILIRPESMRRRRRR